MRRRGNTSVEVDAADKASWLILVVKWQLVLQFLPATGLVAEPLLFCHVVKMRFSFFFREACSV
jgi:hypothetical protein